MKQNDDVWCIAQGEAATSALAWTSKRGGLQRGGKKIFLLALLFGVHFLKLTSDIMYLPADVISI
jgi:hypothetical protein